ncbi:MAG: HAMP domain-containing sensor histidine kinase [Candidatus Limivivens sp.]|nr:HAMP domain-containing sensor histidine kinase [Candidatus Limivivens sp.]
MKLKTRLIITFLVILCVPLLLIEIALYGFMQFQIRSIETKFGITNVTYDTLSNSIQIVNSMTSSSFEEMQEDADVMPEQFLDSIYQDSLNERLKEQNSYLIVRYEGQMVYCGSDRNVTRLFRELPEYGSSQEKADRGTYIGKDVQAFVKQVDLEFQDGTTGSAFIITGIEGVLPQLKAMSRSMLIAMVLILVITGGLLSAWIYRGISAPMKKLKEATQHIKEGNLDFVIEADGDDEFSDLCRDFEEMRQRLVESAEEKVSYDKENKELISNISHDLKTPITAIKGYVEGIMDGVADTPEKMDKYIRTIYNKANDMDRLINELTFYSKIDTNRIPYTFNKINVADYFEDCIEEVGLDLEAKGIDLSYINYADRDTLVIADAEQLKRVINNIISNSVKYMDKPKGFIHIRVKDVGDFIQVEIEDNGKGIGAKELPNIFDRFYRTDASRNSAQGGSGIGLSIVRKIIEDHGGKIWASSKLGVGTVMYFVLRKYQEVPVS